MKSIRAQSLSVCNLKMKGKLTQLMPCKCCVAQNFKWSERVKEANREIKQFDQT